MATTTPNYGWPVPTSTDLVKDGAVAIEALGDAIDATVFGLGGGLKLIKTQVIGTTVASVNVTSAFSSTYDRYKVFISGSGVSSTGVNLLFKLGASTTGYYWAGSNVAYTGTASVINGSNGTSFAVAGYGDSTMLNLDLELINPGTASFTKIAGCRVAVDAACNYGGIHTVATAYTDFTITPSSGTITGGTIYVYGYGAS